MTHFKVRIGGRALVLPPGQQDVGRMSDCWLILDDELISRYHARFHVTEVEVEVEDLGSRNGTYLNGQRVAGRERVEDGDKVRIGREVLSILGSDDPESSDGDNLRRTLAPGEDTRFPSLIGQLVEKSLKVGKIKDAERYALALTNQLLNSKVPADHPAAKSCVSCLLSMAEQTSGGVWIDRVFRLFAVQKWVMDTEILAGVRKTLDRIPRIPGTGMRDYERALRGLQKDGARLPPRLVETIAEIADTFGVG